ncbi:MAG: plasmid mobilization relaxosome protein MobC [Firmicutes bacterium]|nr:plasmid mobilization relaxosome protein MobC [Bacillota bacterium]
MVSMRFNEHDLNKIKSNAKAAKMDVTSFVTAAALNKSIVIIGGLDEVLKEQKAIGRNLNQLTTLCNMGKIQCLDLSKIKTAYGIVLDKLCEMTERCG